MEQEKGKRKRMRSIRKMGLTVNPEAIRGGNDGWVKMKGEEKFKECQVIGARKRGVNQ